MTQSSDSHKTRRLARVVLGAIGRALVTAIQVFGATIKTVSGGGDAPLLPPSTKASPRRSDYRP